MKKLLSILLVLLCLFGCALYFFPDYLPRELHPASHSLRQWVESLEKRIWPQPEPSPDALSYEVIRAIDGDTLLIKVHQTGVACHTGTYTCFSGRKLVEEKEKGLVVVEPEQETSLATVLNDLYNVIQERQLNPVEGSYTNYLFEKGQDKILKKVGEEAVETVIASKNNKSEEVLYEMGDLWYHCLVLLAYHKLTPDQLLDELMSRRKGGNYHKFTGKTGVRPDM